MVTCPGPPSRPALVLLQTPPVPEPLPPPTSTLTMSAGYEGGFYLRSVDGEHELKIGGLVQSRGVFFEPGLGGRSSAFDLQRARLEIGGTFDRAFHFLIEPRFQETGSDLGEAYIALDLWDERTHLFAGRVLEPFGLEEDLGEKHIDFVSRSLVNQLAPGDDVGVAIKRRSDTVDWGVAVFNGTAAAEENSDKDVAARIAWRSGRGLRLGAAATYGNTDAELGDTTLDTEAAIPFATFLPGTRLDGERGRFAVEALWLDGPFAMYGEIARVEEDVSRGANDVRATIDGMFVAASYFLTGEHKSFAHSQPLASVHEGGGAWQIAARISHLSLDDDLVSVGALPASGFADEVLGFDAGVNWYPTGHTAVRFHVIHTRFGDEITFDGDERDDETALLVQIQMHF